MNGIQTYGAALVDQMATRWRPKQGTATTVDGENAHKRLRTRDDCPVRCTADAGSGDPRLTVTGDRKHQVGSCRRPEAHNQSLMTKDRDNLKKIKEAKNREPDQYSLSFQRSSFREVLTRDSGNRRFGAGYVRSEVSLVSPKHTRHAVSSSEKSTCQPERRSSEGIDPFFLISHPFLRMSPNTSPRRTDLETSGSVVCKNKDRMVMSTSKAPVKLTSSGTKKLLAHEIENKEIKLASKLSEFQSMHTKSTSDRQHNRQFGERKPVLIGLSRIEQNGAQNDSPLLNKRKVGAVQLQNINSSFSRTCTQAPCLSKDSRTENLLPHYNSKALSRTIASKEQIHEKNKDELLGDSKLMKSTTSLTPNGRRKAKPKKESLPLMSSKKSTEESPSDGQGSISGGRACDSKESLQEVANKLAYNVNENPQPVLTLFTGLVLDRDMKKRSHSVQELCNEHTVRVPYIETDSSLKTSPSSSLSDVQNTLYTDSIVNTNESDANMNKLSVAGEEACLATGCKSISKFIPHSIEVICQLPDNSDARFSQLAIQSENMQDICRELESYNLRSEKHCQQLGIDKNRASIIFNDNLCDKQEKNGDPELICDDSRVSKNHHGQDSNKNETNGYQELNTNRGKNFYQTSENNVVIAVYSSMEIDNSKVWNVCPQLERDSSKIQKMCPEPQSDSSNVQTAYTQLEYDEKFQNVLKVQGFHHLELQSDDSKVQNKYLELEGDSKMQNVNSKFQNVFQEQETHPITFQNVYQESNSTRTKFQNSNSKFQNLHQELKVGDSGENLCQENDTALQIQGLWQPQKSKNDPSSQSDVDFSLLKRTGLLNKILDKAELNLESLSSLIPQLEDCSGIMSPLDFRMLNLSRDIDTPQSREDEDDVYDEKLEKALKESEQLLDELRMLTGGDMDLLLGQCTGSLEEAVPGVPRRVASCKKDLKMFMA